MAKRKIMNNEKDQAQDITLAVINSKLEAIARKDELIYQQVQATNGRVKSLEIWRAYMIGGAIVLVSIIGWIIQAMFH